MYRVNYPNRYNNQRVGFLGPFLLGGIAGGLVAPLFNNPGYYPYQTYNNYYFPYPPYYPVYYR